jgi:hypothetical protein
MRRAGAAAAALLVLVAGAVAISSGRRPGEFQPREAAERPKLMLVTSLPLIFPEEFTLEGGGSKALAALETRYAVVPIGTTDTQSLKQGRLLLMAHPLAQPAESLVELDRWVRGGGRLLLLADPRLDWPSSRPLGDRLRPPPSFADTGLLAHWGLRLEAPDEPGPKERDLGGRTVRTDSPGSLSGTCRVSSDGFVARCRLGNGRATIVADADLLNVEANLDALLAELAALER